MVWSIYLNLYRRRRSSRKRNCAYYTVFDRFKIKHDEPTNRKYIECNTYTKNTCVTNVKDCIDERQKTIITTTNNKKVCNKPNNKIKWLKPIFSLIFFDILIHMQCSVWFNIPLWTLETQKIIEFFKRTNSSLYTNTYR